MFEHSILAAVVGFTLAGVLFHFLESGPPKTRLDVRKIADDLILIQAELLDPHPEPDDEVGGISCKPEAWRRVRRAWRRIRRRLPAVLDFVENVPPADVASLSRFLDELSETYRLRKSRGFLFPNHLLAATAGQLAEIFAADEEAAVLESLDIGGVLREASIDELLDELASRHDEGVSIVHGFRSDAVVCLFPSGEERNNAAQAMSQFQVALDESMDVIEAYGWKAGVVCLRRNAGGKLAGFIRFGHANDEDPDDWEETEVETEEPKSEGPAERAYWPDCCDDHPPYCDPRLCEASVYDPAEVEKVLGPLPPGAKAGFIDPRGLGVVEYVDLPPMDEISDGELLERIDLATEGLAKLRNERHDRAALRDIAEGEEAAIKARAEARIDSHRARMLRGEHVVTDRLPEEW